MSSQSRTFGLEWTTVRTIQTFLLFFTMACGGGGCGGCSCVGPIPGGFPIEERVENAAQVRLTSSGVQFIEDNIDSLVTLALPGGLEFDIPRTEGSSSGVDYDICPDSDCKARIEISEFELTPEAPNRLQASIRVILDSRDSSGARRHIPVRVRPFILPSATCRLDLDSRRGGREFVGLVANIDFVAETQPARLGYTKVVVSDANLAPSEGIEDDDLNIGGCSGYAWLLNLFKGTLVGLLEDQVGGILQGAIEDQLCTRQGEFGCPRATFPEGGDTTDPDAVCRYGMSTDSACVPMLLGTDGQGDLGAAFLGSVSPGTHAPGQFVLASGGDGEAVSEGLSLFMYGGFLGTTRDFATHPAHNPCVPVVDPPPLPTIPRAATFRGNSVPGLAADPHLGIGLSESFLNHAGYGMYDGGLLCIGTGTSLSQQLSTGLFSLLVRSLSDLAFPSADAPIAISLRPQKPPTFEVGSAAGEPSLTITLDDLQMDFYVWSSERFIRFMTYQSDLSIPINLVAMDGEIVPEITEIGAENSTVTNSDLLREDPAMLADTIQSVLTSFASMFTSGLGGFALPELAGLELQVPEGGIRGINDGGEEFLGIFANLAVAPASAYSAPVQTELRLGDLHLDRHAMRIESWKEGALPQLELHIDVEGPEAVEFEYSWRIDDKMWSPWTREPDMVVEDEVLLFQARHVVEARARVVGERDSVDVTPAFAEVLVDILEPQVILTSTPDGTEVRALDVLTDAELLHMRYRAPGDEWSDWHLMGAPTATLDLVEAEVEVRDEAGNIGRSTNAIIRGIPNPAGGDCACTVPGGTDTDPSSLGWLALVGLAMGVRRRRGRRNGKGTRSGARRFPLLTLLALSLALGGCDCGGGTMPPDGDLPDGEIPDGGLDAADTGPPGPLEPGILATYLDMEAAADGTLYLSGYSAGVPGGVPYGDLVVGEWNGTDVDWTIVDGAPDSPVVGDPTGWRGGVRSAGDDVGRWTSLALDGDTLWVAYQDVTNGALKVATGTLAGGLTSHVVDDEGLTGSHTSIVHTGSGLSVSYLTITPAASLPGRPTSSVRVATASGSPTSAAGWTSTEVASGEIPCRPQYCPEGSVCTVDGECAMDGAGCAEDCGSGAACVASACVDVLDDPWVEDHPVAIGLYSRLAITSTGLALVYYDRTAGDLYGAAFDGTAWGTPFLIDGYSRPLNPSTPLDVAGDSGIGASLVVDDAGTWHVTYVDGAEERLRYAQVQAGAVTLLETIDDGATDGTAPHPDGRHIVGDDSSVSVTSTGEVRVAYQDATAQRALLARRVEGAWTIAIVDMEDSTGYWTRQALTGTTSQVAYWWRNTDGDNGVRVSSAE